MAGTGHKYEISNPSAVERYVSSLKLEARTRDLEIAEAWLSTKHFLRYLTGTSYTFPLKPGHLIQSHDPDERRPHLIKKIGEGFEIRRFAIELFEDIGPDIHHVLDWIGYLKQEGDPLYSKVARIDTAALVARSKAWTQTLASRNIRSIGETESILEIDDGLAWVELKDGEALAWEGAAMSHCLGGDHYSRKLADGTGRYYSLRRNLTKSILTVEIDTRVSSPSLVQVQRFANQGLPLSLCEPVIALLNKLRTFDTHGVGRRYALSCREGKWATIFDTWQNTEFLGRQVLSDGPSVLFMRPDDTATPLMVVNFPPGSTIENIDVASFRASDIYARLSDGVQRYQDQVEICAIGNAIRAGNDADSYLCFHWHFTSIDDNGNFVPSVDRLDRVEMENGFFYKRTDKNGEPAFLLPHSADPARILMEAKKSEHLSVAEICSGQRISKAEASRAIEFLNVTNTRYWKSSTDEHSQRALKEFEGSTGITFIYGHDEWKPFKIDMATDCAKLLDGTWSETDYLLRFRGMNKYADIYMKNGRVTTISSFVTQEVEVKEIARKLTSRRAASPDMFRLGLTTDRSRRYGLYHLNGKWTFVTSANLLKRAAEAAASAEADRGSIGEGALSGLIETLADTMTLSRDKNDERMTALYNRLLAAWFDVVEDFAAYPIFPGSIYSSELGDQQSCLRRVIHLAQSGHAMDVGRSKKQFGKMMKRLSSFIGRDRKIRHQIEKDFLDLIVYCHNQLPSRLLKKSVSYYSEIATLPISHDGVTKALELVGSPKLSGTRLLGTILDHCKRSLSKVDPSGIDDILASRIAELYAIVAVKTYLLGDEVTALGRFVDQIEARQVADPEVVTILKARLMYFR